MRGNAPWMLGLAMLMSVSGTMTVADGSSPFDRYGGMR